MKDINILKEFLKLAQKYFRRERSVEFYACKLGISPEELSRIIWNTSDSTLSEWLAVME